MNNNNFYNTQKRRFVFLERLIGIAVILALLSCCGCSNKVPLTGKVTFSDDNSPLTQGIVCFSTGQFVARGPLSKDGSYQISSTGQNDGLPKGKYKVYLVGAELVSSDGSGNSTYTPLIDSRYDNPDTSDIECEVDKKTRRFDFTVERARKKK